MILYKDILTHEKVFTDTHKVTEVDNLYYIVEGEIIESSGKIDEALIGSSTANDDQTSSLRANIVSFLVEVDADLNDFKDQTKTYIGRLLRHIKASNPAEAEAFKAGASSLVSNIIGNFDRYSFFRTEADYYDRNGMIIPFEQEAPRGEEKVGDSCKIIVFKAGVFQEST